MFVVQRFARQKTEDGPDPSANWGADLAVADTEDPDDEDHMSIPDVGTVPASGKIRASMRDWSNDDCEVLEVLESCSTAFSYSVPSTSADSGEQVHDVPPLAVGGQGLPQKRTVPGSSDAGPSKKKQRKKVVLSKHHQRPTTVV